MRSQDQRITVLIVEDEPIIRFYEAELAEGAGFITLLACDAEEALNELEGSSEIQILLTDVNMPGACNGLQLADLVRQRWPDISIIIASAQTQHIESSSLPGARFISKPFTPTQFFDALNGWPGSTY